VTSSLSRISSVSVRALLGGISGALTAFDRNPVAYTRVIADAHGSPYIARTYLPRIPRPVAMTPLIHAIHRPDRIRWCHNHPWRRSRFVVVSGGYSETRLLPDRSRVTRRLSVGDVNSFGRDDFHSIDAVDPHTWTVGLVADECQEWGFMVDDVEFVPSDRYFREERETAARELLREAEWIRLLAWIDASARRE